MKILLFSDIHFGTTHRFSYITSENYTTRELEHLHCAEDIISQCKQENIDRIVFCGDLYQTVGDSISAQTQMAVCEFIDKIRQVAPVNMLVGNHDKCLASNYRDSHKLVPFKYWDRVKVYDEPTVVDNFVYIPYCTSDEKATSFLEQVEDPANKIVFSHLELKGINLGNGIETTHGVDLDLLSRFKLTFQGHYHSGGNYRPYIKVIGSTQRLSFKDPGRSRNNIIIYDTETNTMKRKSFTCPDWLSFTDDNIDEILKVDSDNYVKVDISTDMLLTPEINAKLERFKGVCKDVNLTRLTFDKKNISKIADIETEDDVSIIKQFIDKTENSDELKQQLLLEGKRLLDKVK